MGKCAQYFPIAVAEIPQNVRCMIKRTLDVSDKQRGITQMRKRFVILIGKSHDLIV